MWSQIIYLFNGYTVEKVQLIGNLDTRYLKYFSLTFQKTNSIISLDTLNISYDGFLISKLFCVYIVMINFINVAMHNRPALWLTSVYIVRVNFITVAMYNRLALWLTSVYIDITSCIYTDDYITYSVIFHKSIFQLW